jgi:hypothetical protein
MDRQTNELRRILERERERVIHFKQTTTPLASLPFFLAFSSEMQGGGWERSREALVGCNQTDWLTELATEIDFTTAAHTDAHADLTCKSSLSLSLSLSLFLSLTHSLSPFPLPSFFLFLFPFAVFNTIPNYLSVFEQCNFFFYISGHR